MVVVVGPVARGFTIRIHSPGQLRWARLFLQISEVDVSDPISRSLFKQDTTDCLLRMIDHYTQEGAASLLPPIPMRGLTNRVWWRSPASADGEQMYDPTWSAPGGSNDRAPPRQQAGASAGARRRRALGRRGRSSGFFTPICRRSSFSTGSSSTTSLFRASFLGI